MTGQGHWLTAATGLLLSAIVGIVAFYAVMPFLYMFNLKDRWFGTVFFGLAIPPKKLRRALSFVGRFLTYFGFACRIWIISGVEATFILVLLAAAEGKPLKAATTLPWMPYALLLLLVVTAHTWVERRNLGMSGLTNTADRTRTN
ncbi:MAG: hypothetical protein JW719_07330 [Pirellulales bacterium]|nr:hypothetical protein [Pirellulales bacterium]